LTFLNPYGIICAVEIRQIGGRIMEDKIVSILLKVEHNPSSLCLKCVSLQHCVEIGVFDDPEEEGEEYDCFEKSDRMV